MDDISIERLIAVQKVVSHAVRARKAEELTPGQHRIEGPVTITLDGTLTVGKDYTQSIVGKAKPWAIVAMLMAETNALRDAAGMVGIDLARVAVMADALDKELWTRAKNAADEAVAAVKAETLTHCKGKTTWKGSAC